MKKTLLLFDKVQFDLLIEYVKLETEIYNSLAETVKANAPEIQVDVKSLSDLIRDAKGYLFDLMAVGNQTTVYGFSVNRTKAIEIIDFPDNFDRIIEQAKICKAKIDAALTQNTKSLLKKMPFAPDQEGNKFVVPDGYIANAKTHFETYTQNELQQKVVDAVNMVINGLMELDKLKVHRIADVDTDTIFGLSSYMNKPVLDANEILKIRG